ncbi:hypothetical protein IWQ60_001134 [Tieghemiomyces parasiticus]|uniref:Uncharacterized protein n=1 Tax=Tieghemiomyces parasiticus TaxID=78921 RepID=A0A9W8DWV1_9FUNG|nr:hypothetical protein IWQ60_001134 [Tieghemiomyces parasiticus]
MSSSGSKPEAPLLVRPYPTSFEDPANPTTSTDPSTTGKWYHTNEHSQNPLLLRAGLTPPQKIGTVVGTSGIWGFALGAYEGGRKASMQYLAEHMHKLPTTHEGWYFYHKHKNYRVMLASIYRGTFYATKFMVICGAFSAMETAADVWKGDTDFMSTTVAALTTAGLFAAFNRLPRQSFRHALKIGLFGGLGIGVAQDMIHYLRDQPPYYVNWWRAYQKPAADSSPASS